MIVNNGIPVEKFDKVIDGIENIKDQLDRIESKIKGKKNTTQVAIVMDKSGSMDSIRESTISGFNEYIDTLKSKGGDYDVTLTYFDTSIEQAFVKVPISKVRKLTASSYRPGGMTALYDGVGQTIDSLKEKVSKDTPVLLVIITDGGENSSKEYNQRRVADLIKSREKEGWTFVFIGANQDSWATAQTFGLTSMSNVVNFNATAGGTKSLFRGLGEGTVMYSSVADAAVSRGAVGAELSNSSFFSNELKANIENSK
jgi:von Willebrand factor type A domain